MVSRFSSQELAELGLKPPKVTPKAPPRPKGQDMCGCGCRKMARSGACRVCANQALAQRRREAHRERDREILRVYDQGLTRREIGKRYGLTYARVSQLFREAVKEDRDDA